MKKKTFSNYLSRVEDFNMIFKGWERVAKLFFTFKIYFMMLTHNFRGGYEWYGSRS